MAFHWHCLLLSDLQYTTVNNLNAHGRPTSLGKNVGVDVLDYIHPLHDTAEGNEASIQLRRVGGGDEKPRVVTMDAGTEHGNDARASVGDNMRLVGDGVRTGVGVVAPRRPEGGMAPTAVAVETKDVAHAKADRLIQPGK